MPMVMEALDAALDRLEHALAAAESAISTRDESAGKELAILKVRHRKLKESVAQELRQLDLLLAGLPK